MRMNLLLPLPKESWLEYKKHSQNQWQAQCPHVHYLPYCDKCQTLMGWEPPLPIKPTPKHLIISFGKLKEYCGCHHIWREQEYQQMKKTCQQWKEEQFVQAAYKRNAWRQPRKHSTGKHTSNMGAVESHHQSKRLVPRWASLHKEPPQHWWPQWDPIHPQYAGLPAVQVELHASMPVVQIAHRVQAKQGGQLHRLPHLSQTQCYVTVGTSARLEQNNH